MIFREGADYVLGQQARRNPRRNPQRNPQDNMAHQQQADPNAQNPAGVPLPEDDAAANAAADIAQQIEREKTQAKRYRSAAQGQCTKVLNSLEAWLVHPSKTLAMLRAKLEDAQEKVKRLDERTTNYVAFCDADNYMTVDEQHVT